MYTWGDGHPTPHQNLIMSSFGVEQTHEDQKEKAYKEDICLKIKTRLKNKITNHRKRKTTNNTKRNWNKTKKEEKRERQREKSRNF